MLPRGIIVFKALTLMAAFAGCATILSAQAIDPDTFKVNYFSHANVQGPDGTVRITNAGTSGGNLCADIYVFDPNQELSECWLPDHSGWLAHAQCG
jgi:hypothetical protein